MKKTIIALCATGFLGSVMLTPTPAAAWIFFAGPALASKYDPNFKAVNPYEKKAKVKKAKAKKKM